MDDDSAPPSEVAADSDDANNEREDGAEEEEEAQNGGSDREDAHSDHLSAVGSGAEASDSEQEAPTPRKSTRSTKKTATTSKASGSATQRAKPQKDSASSRRKKGKSVVSVEKNAEEEEGTIFDIVMNHPKAIEAQISDWMADFNADHIAAMVDLINFLLQSAGCPGRIDKETFEDQDNITEQLEELQNKFETKAHQDYPLIAKGRGKAAAGGNKFRKHMSEFWEKWVDRAETGLLFADDGWCFENLIIWLVTMSSSMFRPFRHTATAVTLVLLTNLCDVGKRIHDEWTIANRQLQAEQKRNTKGQNAKQKQTEKRVSDLHGKKIKLEMFLNDIFDSVFVHRYRDTDAIIRAECIRDLGWAIFKFPDVYLDAQYLRYIGWLLSDKTPSVRLEALKSLARLYQRAESMVSGLRAFTERFRPRLLEMAIREKETSVRHEAVKVISLIAEAGLIDDADRDAAMPLLFDQDPTVRKGIAQVAYDVWMENFHDPLMDQVKANRKTQNLPEAEEKKVALKSLCEMLIATARTLESQQKERQAAIVGVIDAENDDDAEEQAKKHSQSQPQASVFSSLDMGEDVVFDDDDDDETDELRRERIAKSKTCEEILGWLLVKDRLNEPTVGFGKVDAAVSALWKVIEPLQDWEAILEYLSADGSTEDEASQSISRDPLRLDDQEETTLLYVANAVISHTLSGNGDDDKKTTATASATKIADARSNFTRKMISVLPKYFQKYAAEYTGDGQQRLHELLIIVRHMDMGMYFEMRMLKAYEVLLDHLGQILLTHSNCDILHECGMTLQYLLGSKKPVENDTPAEEPPRKRKGRTRAESSPSGEDNSAATLHPTTIQKVEEIVEEVISNQVSRSLLDLEDEIKRNEETAEDMDTTALFALRDALRRLRELWKVIDLGGMPAVLSVGSGNDLEEWSGLFQVLNGVINAALGIASKRQQASSASSTVPSYYNSVDYLIDELVGTTLHVMCLDVSWELKRAFSEATGASEEDADADEENSDERIPKPVVGERADELLQTYRAKSARLFSIAEAIFTQSDAEWIVFRHGVKLAAFEMLGYMYLMVNGDAAVVLPEVARRVPDEVQRGIAETLGEMTAALATVSPGAKFGSSIKTSDQSEASDNLTEFRNDASIEEARHRAAKLVADLGRMVVFGLFDPQHAVLLLKYYGFGEVPLYLRAVSARQLPAPILGTIWDGLAGESVKDIIGMRLKLAAEDVLDEVAAAEESGDRHLVQRQLHSFRDVVRQACQIIVEGLSQSITIYYRNGVDTMDPALNLVKFLISVMKAWVPIVKESPKLKLTHGIVVQALLSSLKEGADSVIQELKLWKIIRGQDSDLDTEYIGTLTRHHVRKTVEEINEAWRVWGSLGGIVQQIVHELGALKKPSRGSRGRNQADASDDEEESILNVEDIVNYVEQGLLDLELKPIEGAAEWQAYWTFVKALEKGDTSTRRRGRKPKAVTSREQDGTPASTPAKKKKPVTRRSAKVTAKDDSEEQPAAKRVAGSKTAKRQAITEPGTPTRARSSRSAASARKSYREDDEEKEIVDENMMDVDQETADESGAEQSEADAPVIATPSKKPVAGGSKRTPKRAASSTPRSSKRAQRKRAPIFGLDLNLDDSDRESPPEIPQSPLITQQNQGRRGTKRSRPTASSSIDNEKENRDRTPTPGTPTSPSRNSTHDGDGFMSSPEVVIKKRIRVG
ncbi:hypothetical protein DFS34DRAFT_130683 [Phlyctochytrium arcticum]|nr:hypothetical protein DFS34DRAFT_130683 [Phlyctochytrium arcticum]